MGEKDLDQFFESLRIGLALHPIDIKLEQIDQAEKLLIDIRSINDLSKKEVDEIDKNNYEGKRAELKKPIFENNTFSSKLVKYNFDLKEDLDAYYEAFTKYDELIYSAIRKLRDYRISLQEEKERIISGEKQATDQEKISEQKQNKDDIKKLNDTVVIIEGQKKKSNKGITKRIEKLIEDLELKKSSEDTAKICNDVCKILTDEGFDPNWHSVYTTLNKLGVNNERLKLKGN